MTSAARRLALVIAAAALAACTNPVAPVAPQGANPTAQPNMDSGFGGSVGFDGSTDPSSSK